MNHSGETLRMSHGALAAVTRARRRRRGVIMTRRGRRLPRYQRDSHIPLEAVAPTRSALPDGVPTSEEINVNGSLDEIAAVENFLGKTLPEAESLFEENDLRYLMDLLWMGPKAFSFYIVAAINYLKSPSSKGCSDAVNIFWGTVDFRLNELRRVAPAVIPILREAVHYIRGHWKKYHVEPSIYGDLKEKYSLLWNELKRTESPACRDQ
jgi:hypothetical protein